MDPLTHTLVGASLAATRLGSTTRRAVPALVIGANLPDVDVLSYFAGGDAALGFRRGWTHGVLALVVLPAILALLLRAWDRWRPSGEHPLSDRWLFALCYLAVLTHPALDWLNTYGMRWLMPFDGTWFYGDAVFIMDPWLWLALGVGWLVGRRPGKGLAVGWAIVAGLLLLLVVRRAPEYAPVVLTILALLLLALLWRPASPRRARQAAGAGLALAALLIGSLLTLHAVTERRVRQGLTSAGLTGVEELMVGPVPLNPLAWEFVARADGQLRHGRFDWLGSRRPDLSDFEAADARGTAVWSAVEASLQVPGFLDWVRFPWIAQSLPGGDGTVHILDARYTRLPSRGFGGAIVRLAADTPPS